MTIITNNNNNNNDNSNKQDELPFKYYLEKMKNIKSIHLVIIPTQKNVVYYYDVKMTSVQQYSIEIIDKSNELNRYNLKIKLPIHCKIEPRSTIISKEPISTSKSLLDNSIEIKSRLLIDESNYDQHLFQDNVLDDNHSSSIDSINSISSLFNNNNNNNDNTSPQLYCRCCLNSIIKSSNSDIWRTKVLPSSNWIELMDIWLCGCTGTTSFTDFPVGEINSMLNYCFIGDRYLLFHKDNIKELSIQNIEEQQQPPNDTTGTVNIYDEMNKQSTQSWLPLKCDYCKSFIGSVDNSTSNNFRLFKHQISTSININQDNLFKQYQLETFIASQILTESQSSVTFKFLLTSLDDNKIYAMISLLNWETLLLTNYYGNDNDNNFVPIVKILFKSTILNCSNGDMDNQKKEIQELLNKWEFDFEAKRIYLPSEECFQLIEIMNNSNSMFPINANKIKSHSNFNIGILRLRLLQQQQK